MRTWLAPGWHARRERDLCCPADAVFPCSCSSQSARRIISISLRDGRALLERARVARLYWRYPILRHTIPRVGASLAPAERPRSVLLRTPAPARDTRTVTIDWGGGEGGRGWGGRRLHMHRASPTPISRRLLTSQKAAISQLRKRREAPTTTVQFR